MFWTGHQFIPIVTLPMRLVLATDRSPGPRGCPRSSEPSATRADQLDRAETAAADGVEGLDPSVEQLVLPGQDASRLEVPRLGQEPLVDASRGRVTLSVR
jgi:hypothetical protein